MLLHKRRNKSSQYHERLTERKKKEEYEWDGVIPPNKWECVNIGLYFQLFDEVKSF